MMVTRRVAGIVLMMVLSSAVFALAACGGTDESPDGATATATPAASSPATATSEEGGVVDEGQMSEPEQAARAWLALVDEGLYAKSWNASAALFRKALTSEQWTQQLGAARGPLGTVESRRLSQEDQATELPGAPDGEYTVLVFESTFEHKRSAAEQVTVMLEDDGVWRVAGYYIR